MSKIIVAKDKCIGCGACAASFPEIFEMSVDGKSQVKSHNYLDFSYSKEDIESICPVGAISIRD